MLVLIASVISVCLLISSCCFSIVERRFPISTMVLSCISLYSVTIRFVILCLFLNFFSCFSILERMLPISRMVLSCIALFLSISNLNSSLIQNISVLTFLFRLTCSTLTSRIRSANSTYIVRSLCEVFWVVKSLNDSLTKFTFSFHF